MMRRGMHPEPVSRLLPASTCRNEALLTGSTCTCNRQDDQQIWATPGIVLQPACISLRRAGPSLAG